MEGLAVFFYTNIWDSIYLLLEMPQSKLLVERSLEKNVEYVQPSNTTALSITWLPPSLKG